MTNVLDTSFPLTGSSLPLDHGYALYAAVSRTVPELHNRTDGTASECSFGIFPIRGLRQRDRLALTPQSRLRLRLRANRITEAVRLAGAALDIGGCKVRVGVPAVHSLSPAASVSSEMVVIKVSGMAEDGLTPASFLEAARRQLNTLGIGGELGLPVRLAGPRAGEPRRCVMRVKSAIRVGYSLLATGLTADESLRLQSLGLGGRRRMGCGLFLPTTTGEEGKS